MSRIPSSDGLLKTVAFGYRVEEKFRDFLRPKGAKNHEIFRVNGEMRGKFGEIRPPIAKFLIEIGMKLQGEIMANFQILVPKSNFQFVILKSTSKLQIECQKFSPPIPLESRFET